MCGVYGQGYGQTGLAGGRVHINKRPIFGEESGPISDVKHLSFPFLPFLSLFPFPSHLLENPPETGGLPRLTCLQDWSSQSNQTDERQRGPGAETKTRQKHF